MRREVSAPDSNGSLLRLRIAAGLDPGDDRELSPRLRRLVAVARQVGAPIAAAIDAGLAAEDDQRQAERAVEVASSQTRVVAGGLLAAPLILVPGLGRLIGADLIGFYSSALGILVLVAGLGLLGTGALIVAVLLRRVRRRPTSTSGRAGGVAGALLAGLVVWWIIGPIVALPAAVGMWITARRAHQPVESGEVEEAVELIATALGGGVSTAQALRVAAGELPDLAVELRRLAFDLEVGTAPDPDGERGRTTSIDRLSAVLATANDLGAPVAPTLRRFAAELRADELARVLAAAERLPAQLTFPTALCLLPGTVLLVGAPIVHAGLQTVGT